MAREIVARTRPEQAIPDTYAPYRRLVRDGIEFFLSRISRQRLLDLVISQLTLDADACCQARLLALAQRFPTLHKLGRSSPVTRTSIRLSGSGWSIWKMAFTAPPPMNF